jgi:hypothetical protein
VKITLQKNLQTPPQGETGKPSSNDKTQMTNNVLRLPAPTSRVQPPQAASEENPFATMRRLPLEGAGLGCLYELYRIRERTRRTSAGAMTARPVRAVRAAASTLFAAMLLLRRGAHRAALRWLQRQITTTNRLLEQTLQAPAAPGAALPLQKQTGTPSPTVRPRPASLLYAWMIEEEEESTNPAKKAQA